MFNGKLIVDLFAGGGGASLGIEWALGVSPDIAVNHDDEAIAMHAANHRNTIHYKEDVFDVDPKKVCGAVRHGVALLWLSPDCKHFSKAKGGKPLDCNIRSLAWVAVRWANDVRPDVIILENVEEFQTWGPLDDNGMPIKDKAGMTFNIFVKELEHIGYKVEWKELVASDYGAPTTRKRLFMVARCDGKPIVWPEPTHGDPRKYPDRLPWKTAADCIDWDTPAYSIFLSKEEGKQYGVKRPLAEKTMHRIATGIRKFVIDNDKPFVAPVECNSMHVDKAALFVAQHNLGNVGRAVDTPMSTVTRTGSQQQLVLSHVVKMRNNNYGSKMDEPMHTITSSGSHHGEVRTFLMKYYGNGTSHPVDSPLHTVTTKERFGVVNVNGDDYVITDVCMRMFTPRELFRAQGFPDSYAIDNVYDSKTGNPRGRKLTRSAQVRMCGNSVVPQVAKALVSANVKYEGGKQ